MKKHDPSCAVCIHKIYIRIYHVYAALRFASPDSERRRILLINTNGTHALIGGGVSPNLPLKETLMVYLREQLTSRNALTDLETHVASILSSRNFGRMVGGGTFYEPFVTDYGFQYYNAHVVIDVPLSIDATKLSALQRTGHIAFFDGAWFPPQVATPVKDLLRPLLRMRIQKWDMVKEKYKNKEKEKQDEIIAYCKEK